MIIAGAGYAERELKIQMPRASFLGHQSHNQLAILYASCNVFLFPSISETYGNVVAEAMASGLPCVIADGGGTREFITHRVNGFLCSPHNIDEYYEYVQRLILNPDLAERISAQAIRSIQGLSWDTLADRYFQDLLQLAYADYSLSA